MKIRKITVICLSALLFAAAGCNAPSGQKAENFGASSAAVSSSSSASQLPSSSSVSAVASSLNVSSEAVSSDGKAVSKVESKVSQNDSDWVAYDTNKDEYKLHIKRTDGTGDKVIVNDPVLAPCVAGEWVYYLANLDEIDKVKLDGSQKTKVCGTDAFQVYNVNVNAYHGLNGSTSITAEYRDGYILYTCFQLHEVGDKSNPPSYYKLDPKTDKITPVKN